MSTVDHVDATFGGATVRFRMGPNRLEWFERSNGSARGRLQRFLQNAWTVADLKAVLTTAHPDMLQSFQAVDAVVARNKPGTYVGLATTILVAALTGIDAESAVFDEAA